MSRFRMSAFRLSEFLLSGFRGLTYFLNCTRPDSNKKVLNGRLIRIFLLVWETLNSIYFILCCNIPKLKHINEIENQF